MDKLAKLTTDIGKLWETYSGAYFTGIRNTLVLAVVATLIGCVIGLLCGILNTIPYTRQDPPVKRFFLKLLRALIRIYVEVFRGTPMVLQAVFIFYGLPYFTDGAVAFKGMGGIWVAAIIVVSINTGAYMAETVRGGIVSIDPGQTEGAKAIVMVIYLTMTLFASYLLRLWEKALDGPQNYDLNTTDSLAYTSGMYNAPDPNHESQNLDMKGGAAHV